MKPLINTPVSQLTSSSPFFSQSAGVLTQSTDDDSQNYMYLLQDFHLFNF